MNINLTREELDKLIKSNDLERYTQQQFKQFVESNEEILIKGEKDELDDIEKSEYDTLIAELQSFTMVNVFDTAPESKNRIVKSIEFIRPKQVEWDEIEKSEEGEEDLSKARSGIYTDTSLNRKLGRVGQKYGSKKQSTDEGDDEGKFRKERSQAHIDSIKRSIKQLEDRQKTHKLSEIESKALENYKKDLSRAEGEGKPEEKPEEYYEKLAEERNKKKLAEKEKNAGVKIGQSVTISNANRYDSLADKEVKGIVTGIKDDGRIEVSVKGGSYNVKKEDIK